MCILILVLLAISMHWWFTVLVTGYHRLIKELVCVFSGFSGAEQPCGGFSGAGAAAGRACDGRGGGDSRSDGSVRAAGGGEVHPGQHPALR